MSSLIQSPLLPASRINSVPAPKRTTTCIHISALDAIVNANSLFTLAVFLGLNATNPTDSAATSIATYLVSFHIYAFSSFLFSSLVALGLKQSIRNAYNSINGSRSKELRTVSTAHINIRVLHTGILASAAGSALGCVFLTLALVDLVQIQLGTLAHPSWYNLGAVVPLVILAPTALAIYMYIILHAFNS